MDYTLLIPTEVLLIIILFLNSDDIFKCLGVCKRWRNLLNSDVFWKKLCLDSRIFDPLQLIRKPLPLCPWAEAYYCYRIVPLTNWKYGRHNVISLKKEDQDHSCDAWDGHYAAIYYYCLGKINLYSVYKDFSLKQVISVKLPRDDDYDNASISMNDPYIVAARFNAAIIYRKDKTYVPIQAVSVTDTFSFGLHLSNRNTKLGAEIAWDCLWIKAQPVKNTYFIDLKDKSTKYIKGKPHLAFNDNVKLVIAWTKSFAQVMCIKGKTLLTVERNKIRAVDFNSKVLALKVESDLEILDVKTGQLIVNIHLQEKFEFELLCYSVILLEGNKKCSLSCLSTENGNKIWSVSGMVGRASELRCIGSKYYFIRPSFNKGNYGIFDNKGKFIHEDKLPYGYDEYSSPMFNESVAFMVITNEMAINVISFL